MKNRGRSTNGLNENGFYTTSSKKKTERSYALRRRIQRWRGDFVRRGERIELRRNVQTLQRDLFPFVIIIIVIIMIRHSLLLNSVVDGGNRRGQRCVGRR